MILSGAPTRRTRPWFGWCAAGFSASPLAEVIYCFNAQLGNAVVVPPVVSASTKENIQILLCQFPFGFDTSLLKVKLASPLHVGRQFVPTVSGIVEPFDCPAEGNFLRMGLDAKTPQQVRAAHPIHRVCAGMVIEGLENAPLLVADPRCSEFKCWLSHLLILSTETQGFTCDYQEVCQTGIARRANDIVAKRLQDAKSLGAQL